MQSLSDIFSNQMQYEEQLKQKETAAVAHSLSGIEEGKRRLLSDPMQLEKAVANMADYYSPTAGTKKVKGETYGVDTVEASKDSNDPTRGFGTKLRDVVSSRLMDPRLVGVPAGEILHKTSAELMDTPQEDGKSLREKTHEFARIEDSRWFGGVANKKLPGYEAWKADKQLQEKREGDKESWLPSAGELATDTAIGTAFGATAGAVGGGVKGALAGAGVGAGAGLAVGGPVGAGVGAIAGGIAGAFGGEATGALAGGVLGGTLGAAGSIVAAPLKKLLHKTEWYQGMVSSNSIVDKGKAILADMATYIPGAVGAEKALVAGTTRALKGSTIGTLTKDIAGGEGKAPAGPAINLSGERINPEGSWSPDGTTLTTVPRESTPFKPAGLLDSMGDSGALPPPPGSGGAGTIFADGPSAPIPGGFTPELPKLIGGGTGHEWPGTKNLTRGGKETPFTPPVVEEAIPRAQLLLEDLRGNDLEDFTKFVAEARGKVYSDLSIPETTSPTMSENELFKVWQKRADVGIRPFNPYEKAAADVQATVNLTQTLENTAKAKADIAAKPTASNIVKVVKNTKTEADIVPGSDIVSKHEQLSSKGLQEAGFEPITDPDVVPLTGSLPDKINAANERDVFAALGKEPEGGKLRSSVVVNSESELKRKSTFVKVDDPVADLTTKVESTVVPTPVQQKKTIDNVSKYTDGGKAVVDEIFPKSKVTSANDLNLFTSPEGAIDGSFVAARRPLELGADNSGIESAKKAYLETLGEKGKPLTEGEILSDLKEMAGGNKAAYDKLVREQNKEFTTWAKERGFVPNDADRGSEAFKPAAKDRDKYKLIAGMMALGVSAPVLYASLSGEGNEEVSAGMLQDLGKGITRAIKVSPETALKKAALVRDSLEKGLVAEAVKPGQTVMGSTNFQRGIMSDPAELTGLLHANARAGKGDSTQFALMTPYQILESLFKTGSGKLVNAATHLASFVTAGSRTRENAVRVLNNILDEGKIKAVPNQVKEGTAHLVPLGARATKEDATKVLISQAEKRLSDYNAKLAKATKEDDIIGLTSSVKVEREEIGKLRTVLEGLDGSVKEFHSATTKAYQQLAKDHSSVRVALSLEDPTRTLYPWMPELSRSEEVAVGKLRGLLDQYRVRAKERGIATMDNYLPHSPHPEMAKLYQAEMDDILGGAPYQKFYSRTESSKALVPDIHYTMNHYLTDIEPRLQNYDFWEKSGWKKIKESDLIKNNPGMKRAFDLLYDGSKPQEQTWGNIAASRYAEFEAVHKLFLSPSAGLKHLVKMSADIVSVGPSVWIKSLPETVGYMSRALLNRTWGVNQGSIRSGLEKMGIKSDRFSRQLIDDYMDSAIMSGNMRKYMMDMGIESHDQLFNSAKAIWNKTQDIGSTWINVAELADRATSVSSALQMAGKRGMTVDQAMYGTYDLILKNNFLFGQFNPAWLNNPKIRAFLMFQATPFKIFERRAVNAQRAVENVKQLSGGMKEMLTAGMDKNNATTVQKMFGSVEGRQKLKADILNMRSYMRDGQSELKANLIIDTLRQETDFFGTPIMRQLLTDIITVGAATYGGAQAGLALSDHFFHIPFLSTQSEAGKPELAVSPLVSGVMKGYAAWKSRAPEEDFLLNSITKRWLGNYGPLPKTLEKAIKLHDGDIPEIYKRGGDSGYLKYFFGVPGKE